MTRARVTLNENGTVVIPAAFRADLGLKAGDELVMELDDNELRLMTMKHRVERGQSRVRAYAKPGSSLVDELIALRRAAARRE